MSKWWATQVNEYKWHELLISMSKWQELQHWLGKWCLPSRGSLTHAWLKLKLASFWWTSSKLWDVPCSFKEQMPPGLSVATERTDWVRTFNLGFPPTHRHTSTNADFGLGRGQFLQRTGHTLPTSACTALVPNKLLAQVTVLGTLETLGFECVALRLKVLGLQIQKESSLSNGELGSHYNGGGGSALMKTSSICKWSIKFPTSQHTTSYSLCKDPTLGSLVCIRRNTIKPLIKIIWGIAYTKGQGSVAIATSRKWWVWRT